MNSKNKLSKKSQSSLSNGVKPRLIIGLGNPDGKYEKTYHNIGHLAVDFLAKSVDSKAAKKLVKSEVYMNESGGFVKKAAKKNNSKPEEILVIHDDSDIKLGKYKLSFGRSSAGHRGAQSVIDNLKTKNFWRLRIGIRKNKKQKAGEMVLKKISKDELETINKVFKEISKNLFGNE